jgi:general secretion pathway protein N
MMRFPNHAAVLLALVVGLTVTGASAGDVAMRNELVLTPTSGPPGATSTPSSASPSKSPVHVGPLWPSDAAKRRNPLWAIPIGSFTMTSERPIFSPSRRPPAPPAAPMAQPPPALLPNEPDRPNLTLVGTVAADTESIAIFRDEGSRDLIRLRTGESRSGWTLREVRAREVTLLHKQELFVLTIPNVPAK